MKSLSWVFRLFDKFSGPASKIASTLGAVTKNTRAATAATNSYTRAQASAANAQARYTRTQATMLRAQTQMTRAQQQAVKVQQQLNGAQRGHSHGGDKGLFGGVASFGLGLAGWYVTFRALSAMARTVGRAATAIPRAVIGGGIEHTAMKESAVAGMGIVLGDEGLAAKLVKQSVRFAAITPMTTEESMKGYQQLIMGGIAPNKVLGVMSAVSDLSSMNMARRSEAVETISQDLMQIQSAGKVSGRHLRNLSHWGLPRQELFNQLTQIIPALHGATPDVVEKAVSAGKVSADAFFLAFERAMAVKGGGKLGGISEKQSGTMLGLWSTLISRPQELMMNMDKTPAWGKLKTALSNLVNVTDYNTPTGERIQTALSDAFSRWVDKLTAWLQKPEDVEAWVNRVLGTFERLVPVFESMASSLAKLVSVLPDFGGGMGDNLYNMLHPEAKVLGNRDMAINTLNDPNASEASKEYARRVLNSPAAPKGGRAGRMDATAHNTTAHVNVNVNGASREDAKIVGHEVRSQVADMFEQMGIEIGAASGVR